MRAGSFGPDLTLLERLRALAARDASSAPAVEARRSAVVLERKHGRCGGVVEVDERGDPAALVDDRELPLVDRLGQTVVGSTVEGAVAKRMDILADPDRLRRLDLTILDGR
jgi:hypothetical protein